MQARGRSVLNLHGGVSSFLPGNFTTFTLSSKPLEVSVASSTFSPPFPIACLSRSASVSPATMT